MLDSAKERGGLPTPRVKTSRGNGEMASRHGMKEAQMAAAADPGAAGRIQGRQGGSRGGRADPGAAGRIQGRQGGSRGGRGGFGHVVLGLEWAATKMVGGNFFQFVGVEPGTRPAKFACGLHVFF